jgi:uncharacterized protein
MEFEMRQIITLPGIGGSGKEHWQTRWESRHGNMRRFSPEDWDRPSLGNWIASLDHAIDAASEPPLLVAHSLACLLVANWRTVSTRRIAGAFLVAVPDPSSESFPPEAKEFAAPDWQTPFDFPSVIVASSTDPFASAAYSRLRAAAWQTGLVELGALGHINGNSGLGDWPEGLNLLVAFAAGCVIPDIWER